MQTEESVWEFCWRIVAVFEGVWIWPFHPQGLLIMDNEVVQHLYTFL